MHLSIPETYMTLTPVPGPHRIALCLLVLYFVIGVAWFTFDIGSISPGARSPIIDAFYFTVVTLTTVGYVPPVTDTCGRILSALIIFTGTATLYLTGRPTISSYPSFLWWGWGLLASVLGWYWTIFTTKLTRLLRMRTTRWQQHR